MFGHPKMPHEIEIPNLKCRPRSPKSSETPPEGSLEDSTPLPIHRGFVAAPRSRAYQISEGLDIFWCQKDGNETIFWEGNLLETLVEPKIRPARSKTICFWRKKTSIFSYKTSVRDRIWFSTARGVGGKIEKNSN